MTKPLTGIADCLIEKIRDDSADAKAEIARLRGVLFNIAHTFTEDSHGNTKSLPAAEYQAMARVAIGENS